MRSANGGDFLTNDGADFPAIDNLHQVAATENIEHPYRHTLVTAQYDGIGVHDPQLSFDNLIV